MPVNLYTDKFRGAEREQGQEQNITANSGKSNEIKRGWNVIKKAIFTPIGTREFPLERRRRSRRNTQPRKPEETAMNSTEATLFPPDPSISELPIQSELSYPTLAQTYEHTYMVPQATRYPTTPNQDRRHAAVPELHVPFDHQRTYQDHTILGFQDPGVDSYQDPRPGHLSYKHAGKYV